MKLFHTTFVSIFVIPFVSVDGSLVVYENLPALNRTSFGYSDAFSSGGTNWQRQSLAQGFTTTEDHRLESLKWWGSMNNYFQEGLSNLAGFEIVVFNEDFSQQVATRIVPIESVRVTDTGSPNLGGTHQEFFAPLDLQLAAGTYRINIGALYYETNPPGNPWGNGGGFDQWTWTDAMDFDPDLPQMTNLFLTANFPPFFNWGEWTERGELPPFMRSQAQGGSVVIYAVPEPGAIALLGISAFMFSRRRR